MNLSWIMNLPTEELTIESVLRDYGISEEQRRTINPNIIKEFIGGFIPTEEDLQRRLTDDELIELCKRVRCRVLMSRWNAVDDYVRRFRREGRLQNKTREKAHKLLAKAVNRHKETAVYTEEDSLPVRGREWRERKKENLLRLDLWAYDREQLEQEQRKQREEQKQQELVERASQAQVQDLLTDVLNSSGSMDSTETLASDNAMVSDNTMLNNTPAECVDEVACNVTVVTKSSVLKESEASQIADALLPNAFNMEQLSEQSKQVPIDMQGFLEINTESMSISLELPANSQCTPAYEEFNSLVGPTSTQSQTAQYQHTKQSACNGHVTLEERLLNLMGAP